MLCVWIPLVVSLSRMRKVPLALPLESSCLSASFRPSLPKYQLWEWEWEGEGEGEGALKMMCNICLNHHYSRYSLEMQSIEASVVYDMEPSWCVGEYTHTHTHTHTHNERKGVLLTPQLGSSPPEQHNCWECNQFHLWWVNEPPTSLPRWRRKDRQRLERVNICTFADWHK